MTANLLITARVNILKFKITKRMITIHPSAKNPQLT